VQPSPNIGGGEGDGVMGGRRVMDGTGGGGGELGRRAREVEVDEDEEGGEDEQAMRQLHAPRGR
jgi:hypothetical protein